MFRFIEIMIKFHQTQKSQLSVKFANVELYACFVGICRQTQDSKLSSEGQLGYAGLAWTE